MRGVHVYAGGGGFSRSGGGWGSSSSPSSSRSSTSKPTTAPVTSGSWAKGNASRDNAQEIENKICCHIYENESRQVERTLKYALSQCKDKKADCDKIGKATQEELLQYIDSQTNNALFKTPACDAWQELEQKRLN